MTRRPVLLLAAGCFLAVACSSGSGGGEPPMLIEAQMESASNIFVGSEVRVLGVHVGEVTAVEPQGDTVRLGLRVDAEQPLPADVRVSLVPVTLLGERVIQLDPPYTGGPVLPRDAVIPVERTSVPAEVDEVLRSFEKFLSGLDEDALATLIDEFAGTFGGQGDGINRLLDQGSETVRVLADSSGDLNGVVTELANLNTALATRDEQIGSTLEEFSQVLDLFIEEKGEIIASVDSLRRLAAELRPLLDEHTDPVVRDLEILATTLSTVDRNLERVGDLATGGRALFDEFGQRAFEFPEGRIKLDNEGQEIPEALEMRLEARLQGLCLRLGVAECAEGGFWPPFLPDLLCAEVGVCPEGGMDVSQALATALPALPQQAQDELARQAAASRAASEAPPQGTAPGPTPAPGATAGPEAGPELPELPELPEAPLPLPDPRLGEVSG